jgi:hypothetical protein
MATLRQARHRIAMWCRTNRHLPIKEQHTMLTLKLRGHDAYYGIMGNARALSKLRNWVECDWFKWLRRRSYAAWQNWEWVLRLLTVFPLPAPRIVRSVLPQVARRQRRGLSRLLKIPLSVHSCARIGYCVNTIRVSVAWVGRTIGFAMPRPNLPEPDWLTHRFT